MTYTKNNDGTFTVTSRSGTIHEWTVNAKMDSCNCPKFKWILKGQSQCHHIIEVLKGEGIKVKDDTFPQINLNEYNNPLTVMDFIEKYGDEQFDHLIIIHEIIVHRGKVVVLK